MPYFSETLIIGGRSADMLDLDAYVVPVERILNFESFYEFIEELRGWSVQHKSESKFLGSELRSTFVKDGGNNKIDFSFLLHQEIIEHALQKYQDGHLRNAVLDSVIAVFDLIRRRTGLSEDGDRLIGKAFSITKPYLILSDLESESGINDQKGFIQIFSGIYLGVRNPKAHSLANDLNEVEAAQYLVLTSLLARRVTESLLVEHARE